MMRRYAVGVVLLGICVAGAAHADTKPGWCKSFPGVRDQVRPDEVLSPSDPNDLRRTVSNLVVVTCNPDEDAKAAAAKIAAVRDKISKQLGWGDAEWSDAAEWTGAEPSSKGGSHPISNYTTYTAKAPSTTTPIEQFDLLSNSNFRGSYYVADQLGPKLTEAGRLGFIASCLFNAHGDIDPVFSAICQADIEAFDRKKFLAEVASDKAYKGYERSIMRFELVELEQTIKKHADAVKALFAKDDAYKKVFDAALAGRKQFDSADPKLVELAGAADDARVANSNKAFAGCRDRTWPAFTAAIAAIPAKSFENVRADAEKTSPVLAAMSVVANTVNGNLAAVAYASCAKGEKDQPAFVIDVSIATKFSPGFRGPRTSALTAIMNAKIEFDDRNAKLEFGDNRKDWMDESNNAKGDDGKGIVSGIKIHGDSATVTFAKKIETQTQCASRKTTNRVQRIDSSGNLIYDTVCTKWTNVKVDTASGPVEVQTRFLGGLKKGMSVEIQSGAVALAYAKEGAKTPAIVFGTAVK